MDESKRWIVRDKLKRMLILWQLYKQSLEDIRTSEYLKEIAVQAKEEKNKSFQDIRTIAVDQLNTLNAAMFKIKRTMSGSTWNLLMKELSSEEIHEINLLLEEVVEMDAIDIEDITKQIKNWKQDGTT